MFLSDARAVLSRRKAYVAKAPLVYQPRPAILPPFMLFDRAGTQTSPNIVSFGARARSKRTESDLLVGDVETDHGRAKVGRDLSELLWGVVVSDGLNDGLCAQCGVITLENTRADKDTVRA